jgi:redox-sensing transcriptional repressor
MRYYKVPAETIRRLPTYLGALWLLSEKGDLTISSTGLAEFIGVNPWQIRKDFSYFGGFGKRGVGYDIETLTEELKKILKLDVIHKAALVGVGNLGLAVLAYPGFKKYGFEVAACFDNDPKKVGTRIDGTIVEDMSNIRTLRKRGVDIAVLAVPRSAAQQVADDLIDVGVNGILKFSPGFITVPKKVKVITIDIAMDFARLPYYMPG